MFIYIIIVNIYYSLINKIIKIITIVFVFYIDFSSDYILISFIPIIDFAYINK